MADKKTNIATRVREAIEVAVVDAGYAIWDVTYYKEGPDMILEVAIYKDGGISIDDCSAVTRLIDPIIDEMDPIEESYYLQVSSAGMFRDLRTPRHFRVAYDTHRTVTVKLYTPVDGKKEYTGVLGDMFDGESVVLDCGELGRFSFDYKNVAKITAVFEADHIDEEETDDE